MSLTLISKIKIPDYEFSIDSDEVLKRYLLEPGAFIEFMKKGIAELKKIDDEVVKVELNEFIKKLIKG
jgi:hypothetical protein